MQWRAGETSLLEHLPCMCEVLLLTTPGPQHWAGNSCVCMCVYSPRQIKYKIENNNNNIVFTLLPFLHFLPLATISTLPPPVYPITFLQPTPKPLYISHLTCLYITLSTDNLRVFLSLLLRTSSCLFFFQLYGFPHSSFHKNQGSTKNFGRYFLDEYFFWVKNTKMGPGR